MINVLNYTETALVIIKDYLTYPMFTSAGYKRETWVLWKCENSTFQEHNQGKKYVRMEMIKVMPNVLPKSVVH